MKCEVIELDPCRRRIEIEVPADHVEACFVEECQKINHTIPIKGFRIGHAPQRLIEKRYAKEIAREVKNRLIDESLKKCVHDYNLDLLAPPELDFEKIELKKGEPFRFTTECEVSPTFDLPPYKGIRITDPFVPVEEKEIQKELEKFRSLFASFSPTDDPSGPEDVILGDLRITVEARVLVEEKSLRISNAIKEVGGFRYEQWKDYLLSLRRGEERTWTLPVPDDDPNEELRGKIATFSLKVQDVFHRILPSDEELCKRFHAENLEALRNHIRSSLENTKRVAANQAMEKELLDKLVATCSFELPKTFLEQRKEENRKRKLEEALRQSPELEKDPEAKRKIAEEADRETERGVRLAILFHKIAKKEGIEVNREDVEEHISLLSNYYRVSPQTLLHTIHKFSGLPALGEEIRSIKITKFLLQHAEKVPAPSYSPPPASSTTTTQEGTL